MILRSRILREDVFHIIQTTSFFIHSKTSSRRSRKNKKIIFWRKSKKKIWKELEQSTYKNIFSALCELISQILVAASAKNSIRSKQKSLRAIWIRHSSFNFNQSKIKNVANRWCKQNFKFFKFDVFVIDFILLDVDDIISQSIKSLTRRSDANKAQYHYSKKSLREHIESKSFRHIYIIQFTILSLLLSTQ